MARATNKQDLLNDANENFEKLMVLVNSFDPKDQQGTFPFEDRDRNIKDVLIHLYEWHQLLLNWISSNKKGENVPFLPAPYNWKTYGQMNIEFWNKHQSTTFDNALKMLKESHAEVMKVIEGFSNDELFAKKVFPWAGNSALGAYCVSSTSSHYVWAIKKIKTYQKELKALA